MLASGQLPDQCMGCLTSFALSCPCLNNTHKRRSAQELVIRRAALAPNANTDSSADRNINKLSKEPTVLDQLANSLAPSIYGHETIKKGLVSWWHEASTAMWVLVHAQPRHLQGPAQVAAWSNKHYRGRSSCKARRL